MTYSIVARDPATGQMGVATQSQAFAVGSSVPFALPGHGVIASQSMGEPMYGELGLDLLRGGLTADEALTALRAIDPHPERRQVAMVDRDGGIAVYTGEGCVGVAGQLIGSHCAVAGNLMTTEGVWPAMVTCFETTRGPLVHRLLAALHAAEEAGGDLRGRRSAAVKVVQSTASGRPWRDVVVDLRVDDSREPVDELTDLVEQRDHYQRVVRAFELALDGDPLTALAQLERLDADEPVDEPDLVLWRSVVAALAGREDTARSLLAQLAGCHPAFVEAARRFGPAGLVPQELLDRVLPPTG